MLLDVHARGGADELLAIPGVGQVRTAFMEYTEPSIATQLRAFDAAGIETVVVVPLLLTISDHSFDDIPTICGLSADPERVAQLRKEKIEVYRCGAELRFAPLLDFSDLVRTNLARRVRAILGRDGRRRAGARRARPRRLRQRRVRRRVEPLLHRDPRLRRGRARLRRLRPRLVRAHRPLPAPADDRRDRGRARAAPSGRWCVPILVAYDPMFQERIIGRAVERSPQPERVLYRPDSILPEPAVGRWVVEIATRIAPSRSTSRRLSTSR